MFGFFKKRPPSPTAEQIADGIASFAFDNGDMKSAAKTLAFDRYETDRLCYNATVFTLAYPAAWATGQQLPDCSPVLRASALLLDHIEHVGEQVAFSDWVVSPYDELHISEMLDERYAANGFEDWTQMTMPFFEIAIRAFTVRMRQIATMLVETGREFRQQPEAGRHAFFSQYAHILLGQAARRFNFPAEAPYSLSSERAAVILLVPSLQRRFDGVTSFLSNLYGVE